MPGSDGFDSYRTCSNFSLSNLYKERLYSIKFIDVRLFIVATMEEIIILDYLSIDDIIQVSHEVANYTDLFIRFTIY